MEAYLRDNAKRIGELAAEYALERGTSLAEAIDAVREAYIEEASQP